MYRVLLTTVVAGVLALSAPLRADEWKDESGQGRWGPPPWAGKGKGKGHDRGEPPDWARGKGVWDGHLKHGHKHVQEQYYPEYYPGGGEQPFHYPHEAPSPHGNTYF